MAFGPGIQSTTGQGDFQHLAGNLTIAAEGEQLFVYCYGAAGDIRPLAAWTNANPPYSTPGLPSYSDTQSAIPAVFTQQSQTFLVLLPHLENYYYTGPLLSPPSSATTSNTATASPSTIQAIQTSIVNPNQWTGSDSVRMTPYDCQLIQPGELYIFLMNSITPSNVAILTLVDLLPGFELYLTDNAWNGKVFQETEGTYKVRIFLYAFQQNI